MQCDESSINVHAAGRVTKPRQQNPGAASSPLLDTLNSVNNALNFEPNTADNRDYPGLFIVFEGGDGSGKSTQVKLLAEALKNTHPDIVVTREPGGTDIGEKLRSLVLEHGHGEVDAHTEALIFAASRAALAHQLIQPTLERGGIVLCDRYIDSSAAYQGAGRQLGIENVVNLSLWATENLTPDLTILLDVPLDAGRARTDARGAADRMESEPDTFHTVLYQTFSTLAVQNPERYAVIDGTGSIAEVHAQVLSAVHTKLQEQE